MTYFGGMHFAITRDCLQLTHTHTPHTERLAPGSNHSTKRNGAQTHIPLSLSTLLPPSYAPDIRRWVCPCACACACITGGHWQGVCNCQDRGQNIQVHAPYLFHPPTGTRGWGMHNPWNAHQWACEGVSHRRCSDVTHPATRLISLHSGRQWGEARNAQDQA